MTKPMMVRQDQPTNVFILEQAHANVVWSVNNNMVIADRGGGGTMSRKKSVDKDQMLPVQSQLLLYRTEDGRASRFASRRKASG